MPPIVITKNNKKSTKGKYVDDCPIMALQTFEFLKDHTLSLMPSHRKVFLTVQLFNLSTIRPKDTIKGGLTHLLVFCVRFVQTNEFQPIGGLLFNHLDVDYTGSIVKTIAECWKAYICVLWKIGLRIMATVSPATNFFKEILKHLIENLDDNPSGPLTYSVGYCKNIVHIYDFHLVLESFHKLFMEHDIQFWYKGKKCSASWTFIELMLNELPDFEVFRPLIASSHKHFYKLSIFTDKIMTYFNDLTHKGVFSQSSSGTAVFINHLCSIFKFLYIGDVYLKELVKTFPVWRDILTVIKTIKFEAALNSDGDEIVIKSEENEGAEKSENKSKKKKKRSKKIKDNCKQESDGSLDIENNNSNEVTVKILEDIPEEGCIDDFDKIDSIIVGDSKLLDNLNNNVLEAAREYSNNNKTSKDKTEKFSNLNNKVLETKTEYSSDMNAEINSEKECLNQDEFIERGFENEGHKIENFQNLRVPNSSKYGPRPFGKRKNVFYNTNRSISQKSDHRKFRRIDHQSDNVGVVSVQQADTIRCLESFECETNTDHVKNNSKNNHSSVVNHQNGLENLVDTHENDQLSEPRIVIVKETNNNGKTYKNNEVQTIINRSEDSNTEENKTDFGQQFPEPQYLLVDFSDETVDCNMEEKSVFYVLDEDDFSQESEENEPFNEHNYSKAEQETDTVILNNHSADVPAEKPKNGVEQNDGEDSSVRDENEACASDSSEYILGELNGQPTFFPVKETSEATTSRSNSVVYVFEGPDKEDLEAVEIEAVRPENPSEEYQNFEVTINEQQAVLNSLISELTDLVPTQDPDETIEPQESLLKQILTDLSKDVTQNDEKIVEQIPCPNDDYEVDDDVFLATPVKDDLICTIQSICLAAENLLKERVKEFNTESFSLDHITYFINIVRKEKNNLKVPEMLFQIYDFEIIDLDEAYFSLDKSGGCCVLTK